MTSRTASTAAQVLGLSDEPSTLNLSKVNRSRRYLLDAHRQPVPLGAIGDLYIGGMPRNHLNRPELTAELFLRDPFSADPEARMYRTGERARYLPDGKLLILGQRDHSPGLRSFDLARIETCLREHPAVHEAAVLALGHADEPSLVAYVVAAAAAPAELEDALRRHLGEQLPQHLLPTAYMQLAALPRTTGGKLNRKALPSLVARPAYQPPQGLIESTIANIWQELLGLESVGRRDHFFELGGHSLLAVQFIGRLVHHHLNASMRDLFDNPVLHNLARVIEARHHALNDVARAPANQSEAGDLIFLVSSPSDPHERLLELVDQLGTGQTMHALAWPSEATPTTLEAIAQQMVSTMLGIQPHGPYRLLGYSSGGILAHAIARQLLGIDKSIAFLGFIDAEPPSTPATESLGDTELAARQQEIQLEALRNYEVLPLPVTMVRIPALLESTAKSQANESITATRLAEATKENSLKTERAFHGLIQLHSAQNSRAALFCIPGAGSTVTDFVPFIQALDEQRAIYGLEPRGTDSTWQPHASVEAAALFHLGEIEQLGITTPLHLLGHSHGGRVAFEIARLLQAKNRPVASLTLIDTESPDSSQDSVHDLANPQIFLEYICSFESTFNKRLPIDASIIAAGRTEPFLHALHSSLVKVKALPERSKPDMLRGPLATFAAGCRASYMPATAYPGKVHLVRVGSASLKQREDSEQPDQHASSWQRWAAELKQWQGPGHHFSILQAPHVQKLAQWWAQNVASP